MGLRDINQGMKNGPRGKRRPSSSGSGGEMSRIMIALLGYKAFKGSGGQAAQTDPPSPSPPPRRWPLD
jgi:hypothetical protein